MTTEMASAVAGTQTEVPPEKSTLTPPSSVRLPPKADDASTSELSDIGEDDDIGEIEPDHYYGGGKVPVFKPTMEQFRSFKKFIGKIDKYGMKSGIVKVIPPKEWRDALPPLDEAVKTIKVKNPITQEIAGSQGTYRQANIEKQRSYNLPQWRQLCEGSEHQPPARRGERRRNQPAAARPGPRPGATTAGSARKGRGGKAKKQGKRKETANVSLDTENRQGDEVKPHEPPTPTSPENQVQEDEKDKTSSQAPDIKLEAEDEEIGEAEAGTPGKGKGRQPKSVSSRRKYNRRAAADYIDEAAFKDFNYRIQNEDEYTPERCEELERNYWKSITYNSPLYGADMPGSLFDDRTTSWNVAKLENLLDVLGQKVPGVNTAYLYLGMWKSTFAWHLEDVDLYSINYIHFGAPKQWYSISQEDARRFEAAMRSVWPADAKQCSQFLRHKTYLISPTLLQSQFNIRVNRLVHHEGEFVITFPYGYHSGYNLGYNCAESVNFATEAWLEYGRVAKKCNCTEDSVWIDVNDIERKLRGEVSEYEETDDDDGNEIAEDTRDLLGMADLPTPPASVEGKPSQNSRKRKRDRPDGSSTSKPTIKKIRVRIKAPVKEPCILCPNDIPSEQLLPTDVGDEAHRLCALYTPETFIQGSTGSEKVCNVANIDKARLELKCNYCRSKRGACFQCSQPKCIRAYHATCAAAAGVLVDMRDITVVGEDGKESTDVGIDFRCRFHRPKRAKNLDGDVLEENQAILSFAKMLQIGDVIQMQYYHGDIFAGVVVENRVSEQMVLVDILPRGHRVEVEYKWILVHDPTDSYHSVGPSVKQRPPISSRKNKTAHTSVNQHSGLPQANESFCDPTAGLAWGDFQTTAMEPNPDQAPANTSRPTTFWYYLGKDSTAGRAFYTEDLQNPRHNPASNYLSHVNAVDPTVATSRRQSQNASTPAPNPPESSSARGRRASSAKAEEPYQYRSRLVGNGTFDARFERLRSGSPQQAPKIEGARYPTQSPAPEPGQQYRPGVVPSGIPGQASPAMGSNYFQQPPKQSSPVTGTNYFQQTSHGTTQSGAPVSGSSYFQQTPQRTIQSGTPASGSSYFQQPQHSNIQQGSNVISFSFFQQPSQTNTQQVPAATGSNYFQQGPQGTTQRRASTSGSNYFQQTPQGGAQQNPHATEPQTQQRAAFPGSNYFQQTAQGSTQEDSNDQPRVRRAAPGSYQIDPSLEDIFPIPSERRAPPQNTQAPQQPQQPQQYPQSYVPGPQLRRQQAPVVDMGYTPQQPHDPLSRYPYLQECRARCSSEPYQSPYSSQGGFTEPYLPMNLNPQTEPQYQQATLPPIPEEQILSGQGPAGGQEQAGEQGTSGGQGSAGGQAEQDEQRGEKRDFDTFWEDMKDAANSSGSDSGNSSERLRNDLLNYLG